MTVRSLLLTAAALAGAALPAHAESVRLKDVAARVIVVPENRTDVAVEIKPGTGDVAAPKVFRQNGVVSVLGTLPAKIDGCSGFKPGAAKGTVKFKGRRNVSVADLPVITLRTPMDVELSVDGAALGSIGQARSVKLRTERCGAWSAVGTSGAFDTATEGMGDVTVGRTGSLRVSIEGMGDVIAGPTGALTADLEGMGNVRLAELNGPADIEVAGMGGVKIAQGRATVFKASLSGMGGVRFDGTADRVEASVDGMGQVKVLKANGPVARRISGFGRVKVGE